jgi:hypothetical protein
VQWLADWDIDWGWAVASFDGNSRSRTVRVYRMNIWIRSFAVAFLLFSLLGTFGLLWSEHAGLLGRNLAEMIEWAAIALFAAGWLIYVFSAVVLLSKDAIAKRTVLKTERLRFDQILGRRETMHRNFDGSYIRHLQVIPRDPLMPPIKFQKFYVFDAAFYAWYDDLPDLDLADAMRSGRARSL